jgi:hypothetical protein
MFGNFYQGNSMRIHLAIVLLVCGCNRHQPATAPVASPAQSSTAYSSPMQHIKPTLKPGESQQISDAIALFGNMGFQLRINKIWNISHRLPESLSSSYSDDRKSIRINGTAISEDGGPEKSFEAEGWVGGNAPNWIRLDGKMVYNDPIPEKRSNEPAGLPRLPNSELPSK